MYEWPQRQRRADPAKKAGCEIQEISTAFRLSAGLTCMIGHRKNPFPEACRALHGSFPRFHRCIGGPRARTQCDTVPQRKISRARLVSLTGQREFLNQRVYRKLTPHIGKILLICQVRTDPDNRRFRIRRTNR